MPAVLDSANLVGSDNPADDRLLPVIIRSNQGPGAIMQFQGRISQTTMNSSRRSLAVARLFTADHFRSLFAQFQLGAHPLELRCLLVSALSKLRSRLLEVFLLLTHRRL
jgi:hypothetical protein